MGEQGLLCAHRDAREGIEDAPVLLCVDNWSHWIVVLTFEKGQFVVIDSLLEPVLNPVWAWLVHGEMPTGWALLGGAVIMVATTVRTVWGVRDR